MGIYDRDYVRQAPRMTERHRTRPWTATGWLIALCAAVFVINVFLPSRPVLMATVLKPGVEAAQLAQFKESEFKSPPPQWGGTPRTGDVARVPVFLGNVLVAERYYQRQGALTALGYFSTATALFHADPISGVSGFQVWRFITFQFLHADITHLLFNMITLFVFGGMVEHYLGRKRFIAFYLLCGVCGALMYLLLNGLAIAGVAAFGPSFNVPGLLFNNPMLPLVGASAGVFGVIMAGAFLAPNAEVMLLLVIPMRLKTLAYGLLGFALLAVWFGWSNAGGEAAHIGGAIAGFYFIRNPQHLHGMFDFVGQFDPTSRVAKARLAARRGTAPSDIDRILAKIRHSGLHSLTEAEKQALRDASRR